jgi:hypothetical protein
MHGMNNFKKKMHLLASPAENTMKALEKSCREVLFLGVLLVFVDIFHFD